MGALGGKFCGLIKQGRTISNKVGNRLIYYTYNIYQKSTIKSKIDPI